jgi:osmoprotectant transport system substrate-binding protein
MQGGLFMTIRKLIVAILASTLVIGLSAGLLAADKQVVVGNKNFTEQYIMGELLKQVLEANGFSVVLKSDLNSMVMRNGMESGEIDICADYTGTNWMTHLGYPYDPSIGHQALYAAVKAVEEVDNNFVLLDPIWNHSSYCFAVWPEFAEEYNLATMNDLAALYRQEDGKIDTFIGFEFSTRPDGLQALENYYNFHIDTHNLKTAAPGGSVGALENKQTQVAMLWPPYHPKVLENNWAVLLDADNFWPPYDFAPYVRSDTLKQYPEIAGIINELVATFPGGGENWTAENMAAAQEAWAQLLTKVDVEKLDANVVAHDYLIEKGLIED